MGDMWPEQDGLVGEVYEVKALPNTALQLVDAIYKQKLSRTEAREMAEYLDERYAMSDYIPTSVEGKKAYPKAAPDLDRGYGE